MKTVNHIYKLNIAYALISLIALFTACTDNTLGYLPASGDAGEGEVTVQFTIKSPANAQTRQTRDASTLEGVVNDVRVLVFEDGIYKYNATGQINQPGSPMVFTAGLLVTKSPVCMYIVANAENFFENPPEFGTSESDVRRTLVRACESCDYTSGLPMFGTHTIETGLPEKKTYTVGTVKLLRAVAAMDVMKDSGVGNFQVTSLEAFRSSSRIQLIPSEWNSDESPYVTRPFIPRNTTKTIRTKPLVVENDTEPLTIYLPESTAPAAGEDFTKATCLVVGGFYGGSTDTTYYRIDIPAEHNNGNILRNYRYQFLIKSVSKSGHPTAEEAANNESTSITAVVTNWEENNIDMIFSGEQYFGVSERTINLPFRNNKDSIDVTTNLTEFKLQWSDANGEPLPDTSESVEISNEFFKVEIVTREANKWIKVTSLQDNLTDDVRKGYFVIAADPWKIKIQIEQASSKAYKDKYVNILSLGLGIGGFGGTFPGKTNGGDASAVRKLLERPENFGPDGVVPVGFVMFDYLTASTTDADVLGAYLEKYDVIHISYATSTITAIQATAIKKWLEASQHRVLMYTRDTESRNVTMWNTLFPDVTDPWDDSGLSGTSYLAGFTGNEYFTTNGPFGAVEDRIPGNLSIAIQDGTWAGVYTDRYPGQLIPLMKWQGDDRLVLAIDPDRRIVYCGDSNMWQGRNDKWNNTGLVDSDKQRLFANFWAWIIEEIVLPGKVK